MPQYENKMQIDQIKYIYVTTMIYLDQPFTVILYQPYRFL